VLLSCCDKGIWKYPSLLVETKEQDRYTKEDVEGEIRRKNLVLAKPWTVIYGEGKYM